MMGGRVPWRCLVPADAVSFIIGKGGANIRQLVDTTGAQVAISKDGETPESLADKIVTIGGLVEQKEGACRQLVAKLRQMQGVADGEPGVFVIIAPQNSTPVIIGAQGAQIKGVMERSGAEINVGREAILGMTDQPISLNGTLEQVVSAVTLLNGVLQDMADRGNLRDADFVYRPQAEAPELAGPATPPTRPSPPSRPTEREEKAIGGAIATAGPDGHAGVNGLGGSVAPADPGGQSLPQRGGATSQAGAVTGMSFGAGGPASFGSAGEGGSPPQAGAVTGTSFGAGGPSTCGSGATTSSAWAWPSGAAASAPVVAVPQQGGATSQAGSVSGMSFGPGSPAGIVSAGGGATSQTGSVSGMSFGPGSPAGVGSAGGLLSNGGASGFGPGACMGGMGGMGLGGMGMNGAGGMGMNGGSMGMGAMGFRGMGSMGNGNPMMSGMGNMGGMGCMGNHAMGGMGCMGGMGGMGCMGGMSGMGGMGAPMMGGGASGNEMAFLSALQASGINSSQLTLLVPQALVQNILVPRGFMAEIAQRSGCKIDLGIERPVGMRQVTLSGTMVANALASLFLQEKMIQFQQMA